MLISDMSPIKYILDVSDQLGGHGNGKQLEL